MFGIDWDGDGEEDLADDLITSGLIDDSIEDAIEDAVIAKSEDDEGTHLGCFGVIGAVVLLVFLGIGLILVCCIFGT